MNFATDDSLHENQLKGTVLNLIKDPVQCQVDIQLKRQDVEGQEGQICLRGIWFNTNVTIGDVLLVKTDRIENNTYFVDNQSGFVVVNPDQMITGTAISRSIFCLRSSWLAEMFKGWAGSNLQMIVGNLVHELFQFGCQHKTMEKSKYIQRLNELMENENFLFDCFSNKISQEQVRSDAISYIDQIINWIQSYMNNSFSPIDPASPADKMRVLRVVDVEDNIWAPKYGIKGKVDLTLEVEIHDRSGRQRKTMPLELKTGRHVHSFEHQGQVSLYTMMLEGKRQNCDSGLLLYLKDKVDMRLVVANSHVKKSLIQTRNELTHFLSKVTETPEVKNAYRVCSRCSHVFDCTLMSKAFDEDQLPQLDDVREKLIPEHLAHLTLEDLAFFRQWIELIHLETLAENRNKNVQFWDETSEQREKLGVGFAKLRLIHDNDASNTYRFERATEYVKSLGLFAFEQSTIKALERVSLTVEDEDDELIKIANVTGYVKQISSTEIEVACSKSIRQPLKQKLFRIDLLNSTYSSSGVFFTNLLRLMMNETNCERLRQLIIQRVPSRFKLRLDKEMLNKVKLVLEKLNPEQQRAVLRAVLCEDYLLIQAGPGSGKTETIVAMIRVLSLLNKRILITSHTHSAVDNILIKLLNFGCKFLRLGSLNRIHSKIELFSESHQLQHIKTSDELHEFYDQQQIVGSTCLSVATHPIFTDRRFDVCIVDEASQVLLPEILAPLLVSNRFILVGDSNQLPPVVRSMEAQKQKMNEGLLERLMSQSPACIQLTLQYRMNREILRLANECVYNNQLSCANESVANAVIAVSKELKLLSPLPFWLSKCGSNLIENSVVFINTAEHPEAGHTKDEHGLLHNYFELDLIRQILRVLIDKLGLESNQIGIVTPYQRQVRLLRNNLINRHVEISTVDQFQGRDKDVVITSFVRSDSTQVSVVSGEILTDERRLNVAITRPKYKLIMIGNQSTLSLYSPFAKLFKVLRADQSISIGLEYQMSNELLG